ncbi:MAG TPA: glycosyltransferase [Candidatus Megaira endosymbiont of Hartmannula sinica]|nr:glycosyltransferase [Candidatus Megaera endosymbiont of Hartmannula sinica]
MSKITKIYKNKRLNLSNVNNSFISAADIKYRFNLVTFLIIYSLFFYYAPEYFWVSNILTLLVYNIFKMILILKSINIEKYDHYHNKFPRNYFKIKFSRKNLPLYTIFIPLYKEEEKIQSILNNINKLNYPKNKLDVKLIIEEQDLSLIKFIEKNVKFKRYVHLIKVPNFLPLTKAKAMNYASRYIKGKYLAVYDAEDKPDINQLLKSLYYFKKLPKEYVCIQANLCFYNKTENNLTKLFNLEYSVWFGLLLKTISTNNLIVPLGGTSNHFKVKYLKKVGFWDAYNVTEDAELGIRLYLNQYKTYVMNSYTLEESPISINSWIKQRTRWIKGFIQTSFIILSYKNLSTKVTKYNLFSYIIS